MQKKIIIFVITLFIVSASWLFYVNYREINPNLNKNWWSVYFQNPKSDNLSFVIENHSCQTNFRWKVLKEGQAVKKGIENIKKGEIKKVMIDYAQLGLKINQLAETKKIIVQVIAGNHQKEIYKNIK